jgi:hypothetical protein
VKHSTAQHVLQAKPHFAKKGGGCHPIVLPCNRGSRDQ